MMILKNIIILSAVLLLSILIYYLWNVVEPFENKSSYKNEPEYSAQVKLISDKYAAMADSKRPVTTIISTVPEKQQCLVNFYALGCRFTGYMGPMLNGYFDPDIAIQYAVKAGCRVFVLEIDYMIDCDNKYFPRIVVRDVQGKFMINYNSSLPTCNTLKESTIRDVCEKINFYAFSACQNSDDPVIIVLYFLRQPPGSYKSSVVLDYYSNVAKCLEPFKDRLLTNEIEGGTYYRQKQEGQLLINKISDYNKKVLIFSNANTSGFREASYSPSEDLDFLVNLRLSYTQTKLGVADNTSGTSFGILETVQDYVNIPDDRADTTVETTKLKWTICFSNDPSVPVSKDNYTLVTRKFGIHCIPIVLFDKDNDFMFTDQSFKINSFIPKPEPLRYIPPAIVIPGEPNPSMNAAGGKLQMPSVQ